MILLIDCPDCTCPDQGEPTAPTERCEDFACRCHREPEPDYGTEEDS